MIQDKEFKIAENKEEEFWTKTKEKLTEEITNMQRIIEMDKYLIKLTEEKLKKWTKQKENLSNKKENT